MNPQRTEKQVAGTGRSGKTRLRVVKHEAASKPSLFDPPSGALSEARGETRRSAGVAPHGYSETASAAQNILVPDTGQRHMGAQPVGWLPNDLESRLRPRMEQSGRWP